ncbi:transposase [Muricoccus aerilatus]|uniref:transposase n=1 Tax=Muricoccus aerilatus TaxID=452982 RepID=UPI000A037DF8
MNSRLAGISRCASKGAHAVLVLDGAGWHTSPSLRLPENISLLPLPRYAPALNPVEKVWEFLRQTCSAIACGTARCLVAGSGCAGHG